jgi:ferredoxin-NADP reductase/putative sterol carrier protein
MWQSLSHGANYKSAYCMAVCPAGEDVIGPYLRDRKRHIQEVVKPLQEKSEPVYVIKGSDAEGYARKKWKNKTVKHAGNALRPQSIDSLLKSMPFSFQPNQSRGLNATFHFRFSGAEQRDATIAIQDCKVRVSDGHVGSPDLSVFADSRTWLGFLAKERSLAWAFLRGKIRIKGSPRYLLSFGKCFPSAGFRHEPVKIASQPSSLRAEPSPYQQNDAATGKVRWSGALKLIGVVEETGNVKTFRLADPGGGVVPFDHLPGQFLTLEVEPAGTSVNRSYTIASAPGLQDWVEITVKREDQGLVSRWLHDTVRVGDCLRVRAPNGTFSFAGGEADKIVLIGGGVGCTPLLSIARALSGRQWPGDVQLILSFRKPTDLLFREEIAALQSRSPRLKVTVTISDPQGEPWPGPVGRIDKALLSKLVPDLPDSRVHLCGPPAMMDAVKSTLIELGLPAGQCKVEAFGTIKRDPTAKAVIKQAVAGHAAFLNSQISLPVPAGATILDVADAANIYIDSACRSGTCGACRVKLLSGKVRMPVEDALTDGEKASGDILACQAEVEGDVEIEA